MDCYRWPDSKRAAFPTPMINGDTMDPLKSMADGQMYDSKSTLRASYKRLGVVELGNDAPMEAKPVVADKRGRKEAIATAMKRSGVWDELRD